MPPLAAFLVRRALVAIVMLLALTALTYAIFYQIPSEPGRILVGSQAPSPHEIARARHRLGVDKPVVVQYGLFLWRLAHGDLGTSWQSLSNVGTPPEPVAVGPVLLRASMVTGSLLLGGAALLLLLAVPLGMRASVQPGSRFDQLALAGAVAAASLPPLVIGLLLRTLVGGRLGITPPSGYCNLLSTVDGCGGPADWASHLVLPWITFALVFVAIYLRMTRARMIEVLDEPYILAARAKGTPERDVLRSHALRNAILPIITMLGMDVGVALGIAIYVETIFDLPGLGHVALQALTGGFDLPYVIGIVLFTGSAVILLNLLLDLVYALVDPTVTITSSRRAAARTWAVGR
jgi:peptide/nickel transport system permease protein